MITPQPTQSFTINSNYLQVIRQPLYREAGYFYYPAQSGDTIQVVARHFGVEPGHVQPSPPIASTSLLTPGEILLIPDALGVIDNKPLLLPDSEVIFSPGAENFDVFQFIMEKGGYLSTFSQTVSDEVLSGPEIVSRVARNTSVNPRLLLAVIEFRSGWVTSMPAQVDLISPLGFSFNEYPGFYLECSLAAKLLNMGYYGWREGLFTAINFYNGSSVRVAPQSNAGTVALQYFFSRIYPPGSWEAYLYGPNSLLQTHHELFGDPWIRAEGVEPLFTGNVQPPLLDLPFSQGEEWAMTGGLHVDWNSGTPTGALDFAPITGEPRCVVSRAWVLASAAGVVTRSSENIVVISLVDELGAFTGWELFYMHIADSDSIPRGTRVNRDDRIGHPSCEGGLATGTHVHITRKFKGEWIGANGPFPLVLSNWLAIPGEKQFQSTMVRGGEVVTSSQVGGMESRIYR